MANSNAKAWRKYVMPGAIIVTLLLISSAPPARAASFECDKAAAEDEKAICADRTLNDQDVRMAVYLEALGALQLMGANGAMRDDQWKWLVRRLHCGANRECLASLYKSCVDRLRSDFGTNARQRQ
jgi:uncharacterized protein